MHSAFKTKTNYPYKAGYHVKSHFVNWNHLGNNFLILGKSPGNKTINIKMFCIKLLYYKQLITSRAKKKEKKCPK